MKTDYKKPSGSAESLQSASKFGATMNKADALYKAGTSNSYGTRTDTAYRSKVSKENWY